MSYNTLEIINAEKLESARIKALAEIRKNRRQAAALRIIADKLDGLYITKRIEPQLTNLFPGVCRAYISQSYNYVDLNLAYSFTNYSDRDSIFLCSIENRRIDRAAIIKRADKMEKSACALESSLEHIQQLVDAYNTIASQYAEIYNDLYQFFDEIPYADYELERKHRKMAKGV